MATSEEVRPSVLQQIITATRRRVALLPPPASGVLCRQDAGKRFRSALANRPAFIAEIKRASPSRGELCSAVDACERARAYARGGAAAISVVTEPLFFHGSNQDLTQAASCVELPLLRKDFIVSESQLLESARLGASAILLIAAVLSPAELASLRRFAEEELGLAALVEVHDEEEFHCGIDAGAALIGINNRNLHTFEVSLEVSERLAGLAPRDVTLVAESGIRTCADVQRLRDAGIHAFLVGEALMKAPDPAGALRALAQGRA